MNHLRVKGLSPARLHFYGSRLAKIVEYFEMQCLPITEVRRFDVEAFAASVLSRPIKMWTKHAYLLALKKLVSFAKTGDSDNTAPEVAWLKLHHFAKAAEKESRTTPENLLTEDDVQKIISHAPGIQAKAMLSTLFEGALRPGELLTMRVSSVEFREKYCLISVHGKTGLKRIPLLLSHESLKEWLKMHPLKDDPNAPLWITKHKNVLSYASFRKLVRKCSSNAGLKKDVWPYLFRHTQLTRLAKTLTESKLALYAGWVQGSSMARKYVHFSARDLEDIILEANGLDSNPPAAPSQNFGR